MRILITGGSGFIGSKLAKRLAKKNKILIFDIKKNKNFKNNKNIETYLIDLSNKKKLMNIKIKNIDVLLHCAGQPSQAVSFKRTDLDYESNIVSTYNLINWSKKNKVKKIIYASTFNVYKETIDKSGKLSENSECDPKSPYALSKYTAEKYVQICCNIFNIKWNILRMFNVYGPGQNPKNPDLGMVSIFLNMARNQNVVNIKGSLDRFRDLVYVEDVLDAWEMCAKDTKHFNQIFNVGSGKATKISDLLNVISKVLNKKIVINELPGTPGDFKGSSANINKIKSKLKFKPSTKLVDGITNFNNWLNTLD